MPEVFGEGNFQYSHVDDWAKLPQGMSFHECPGVAVDSQDNVYVLTRGDDPIMVFDQEGNFIRTFGKGSSATGPTVSTLPTMIRFWPRMTEFTLSKNSTPRATSFWRLASAISRRPSGAASPSTGQPPPQSCPAMATCISLMDTAIPASTFIPAAGITNFPGAALVSTLASSSVPTTSLSTATTGFTWWDREAHRIQIFDAEGNFITMWNNIHRPDAMVLWQEHIYVGELNGMGGVDDAPGLGHRVTIYDLNGDG